MHRDQGFSIRVVTEPTVVKQLEPPWQELRETCCLELNTSLVFPRDNIVPEYVLRYLRARSFFWADVMTFGR